MIVPMTDDDREAVLLLNQQWCAPDCLHARARTPKHAQKQAVMRNDTRGRMRAGGWAWADRRPFDDWRRAVSTGRRSSALLRFRFTAHSGV